MVTKTTPKFFFSTTELAEALSLSRSSIYLLMASGELPFVHFGTRRLVPAAAVDAFAEALIAGARVPR